MPITPVMSPASSPVFAQPTLQTSPAPMETAPLAESQPAPAEPPAEVTLTPSPEQPAGLPKGVDPSILTQIKRPAAPVQPDEVSVEQPPQLPLEDTDANPLPQSSPTPENSTVGSTTVK